MRVTYNGPLEAVEIAPTGAIVERGKSVDLDTELAERLAEQGDWYIRGRKAETTPAIEESS